MNHLSLHSPSLLSLAVASLPGPVNFLPYDLRNRRNLARGRYSSSPVPDLQGQARLRHSFELEVANLCIRLAGH